MNGWLLATIAAILIVFAIGIYVRRQAQENGMEGQDAGSPEMDYQETACGGTHLFPDNAETSANVYALKILAKCGVDTPDLTDDPVILQIDVGSGDDWGPLITEQNPENFPILSARNPERPLC